MEPWVQFDFHLPVGEPNEWRAWQRAVDYLLSEMHSSEGYTSDRQTADTAPLVRRYGWSEHHQSYMRKQETICVVVLPGSIQDAGLRAKVQAMRERVEKIYSGAGVPQDEILCTAREIHRLPLR